MLQFFYKMKKNKKGFTLIELIVVIAILAILAMLAIPRLSGFSENAKMASDKETAAVLANAAAMYYASNPTAVTSATTNAQWLGLLQGVDLIKVGDETMKSDGFSGGATIALSADGVVSVTLTGDAPPANYVISK